MDALTFGSLLSTREMVFFDVPTVRATSLMVTRVMEAWPGSMGLFLRSAGAILYRDAVDRNVPSAHFHNRHGRPLPCVPCGQGERLTGPQRHVVVAPHDRQHSSTLLGPPDR